MIITDIKLFDFIKRDDMLIPSSYGFFGMDQVPVPTEFVITETQICTPSYARVLVTPFYMLNGNIVDYDELLQEKPFYGTCSYETVFLVEVWENGGDDGHIDYRHKGYRYVNQTQFENEKKYTISHYGGKLPYCMTFVTYDDEDVYRIDKWEEDKKYIEEHGNF